MRRRPPAKSRKFGAEDVERILATLAFAEGSPSRAHGLLREQGYEITTRTLKRWKSGLYRDRYQYVQGLYDRSTADRLRSYHWPAIGEAAESLIRAVAQENQRRLEQGDLKAAARAARDLDYFASKAAEASVRTDSEDFTPGRQVGPLHVEPLAF